MEPSGNPTWAVATIRAIPDRDRHQQDYHPQLHHPKNELTLKQDIFSQCYCQCERYCYSIMPY